MPRRTAIFPPVAYSPTGLGQDHEDGTRPHAPLLIKPSQFHRLVGSNHDNLQYIGRCMMRGGSIATPYLYVNFDPGGALPPVILGHEGRTRMLAIKQLYGDTPHLAHLIPHGISTDHPTAEQLRHFHRIATPQAMPLISLAGPNFEQYQTADGRWHTPSSSAPR